MFWTSVKVVAATLFGDYGLQTTAQALHKNHCPALRLRHVAGVAAALAAARATDGRLGLGGKLVVVVINAVSHYGIDGVRMPKAIDQDGSAWNLQGDFCPQVWRGTIAVLTMSHPDLRTLPAWPDTASQLANVKRWHKHAFGDDLPEVALYYNK